MSIIWMLASLSIFPAAQAISEENPHGLEVHSRQTNRGRNFSRVRGTLWKTLPHLSEEEIKDVLEEFRTLQSEGDEIRFSAVDRFLDKLNLESQKEWLRKNNISDGASLVKALKLSPASRLAKIIRIDFSVRQRAMRDPEELIQEARSIRRREITKTSQLAILYAAHRLELRSEAERKTPESFVFHPLPRQPETPIPADKQLPTAIDIWSHVNKRRMMGDTFLRDDWNVFSHENCHRLGTLASEMQPGKEGLYIPFKGAVFFTHLGIPRRHIGALIPSGMRDSRFYVYIQNRDGSIPFSGAAQLPQGQIRDADASYPFDEWNCYNAGVETDLEAASRGRARGDNDSFKGPLELMVYCTGTLMLAKKQGSRYSDYRNLKAVFKLNAERTMSALRKAKRLDGKLVNSFALPYHQKLMGDEGRPIIDFLKKEFGNAWVTKTLRL